MSWTVEIGDDFEPEFDDLRELIHKADDRFDAHLARLKRGRK